jgi:hypothetical protein
MEPVHRHDRRKLTIALHGDGASSRGRSEHFLEVRTRVCKRPVIGDEWHFNLSAEVTPRLRT